ncbi:MAG: hypothetical protein V4598_06415 [Bdellovibrionota bacterium]
MKLFSLIMLAALLTSTVACGNKKSKSSKSGIQRSTFFVQGNPEAVVAGATMNTTSFLTTSNVSMLENFELYSIYTFTEREEIMTEESGNIEEGNEASTGNQLLGSRPVFTLSNTFDQYEFESTQAKLGFRFTRSAGNILKLDQITNDHIDYPVKVLHYSLKQDQEAFSFLVSVGDKTGKNILAITFVKKNEQKLNTVTALYNYLAGPGVKVGWNKSEILKIRLCSPPSADLGNKYRLGINMWASSLQNLLSYEIETVTTYPPFSDLNFHCLYNVNSYLTVNPESGNSNPAATVPQIDRFKGQIIDSDILIFNSEIQKLAVDQSDYNGMNWVIAHEMGHFFGLDHQFNDSVKSIMSYDGTDYITYYDQNAMKALYQ